MKSHYLLLVDENPVEDRIAEFLQRLVRKEGLGKVTLVRVASLAHSAAVDVPLDYSDIEAADAEKRASAEASLREIAERVSWGSVEHEVVALQGNKAEALSLYAEDKQFDSILMMSRESSWMSRLLSFNLADKIRSAVHVPLTLLPSQE